MRCVDIHCFYILHIKEAFYSSSVSSSIISKLAKAAHIWVPWITGAGSQIRGAGSQIRQDPTEFNH